MKQFMIFFVFLATCAPIYTNQAPPPAATAAPGTPVVFLPTLSTMTLPPQNVWFINGCPQSFQQRRWEIINETPYFLKVRVDGKEVIMKDNLNVLPSFPPGLRAYFFVSRYGQTSIEAQGFYPPDFVNPVVKCQWRVGLSATSGQKTIELSRLWCWGV